MQAQEDAPLANWADLSSTSDSEVERPPRQVFTENPLHRGRVEPPPTQDEMDQALDRGLSPFAAFDYNASRYMLGGDLPRAEDPFHGFATPHPMLNQPVQRDLQQGLPGTYAVPFEMQATKPEPAPQDVFDVPTTSIHDVFKKLNDADMILHFRTLNSDALSLAQQPHSVQPSPSDTPHVGHERHKPCGFQRQFDDFSRSPFAWQPELGTTRTPCLSPVGQSTFTVPLPASPQVSTPTSPGAVGFAERGRPVVQSSQSRRRMFGSLPRASTAFDILQGVHTHVDPQQHAFYPRPLQGAM